MRRSGVRRRVGELVVEAGCRLGFVHHYRYYVHGPEDRLHLADPDAAPGRAYTNALFNTRSGHIHVGTGTVISFNCMLLTGRHEFEAGHLKQPAEQVPDSGYDIRVGNGCWLASGSIVLGGVTVGDDAVVAAGAVVTEDVPPGAIVAGVPAHVIGRTT